MEEAKVVFKKFKEVVKMEVEKEVNVSKIRSKLANILGKLRRDIVVLRNYFSEYEIDGYDDRLDALQSRILDIIGDIYLMKSPEDVQRQYARIMDVLREIEDIIDALRDTSSEKYNEYKAKLRKLHEVYNQLQRMKNEFERYKRIYNQVVRYVNDVESTIKRVEAMLKT